MVAGVLVGGSNGIIVNTAATDTVYLRGLDIQGLGTDLSGINFIGKGVLHVERTLIRRFNSSTASGIRFAPNGPAELYVQDTYIAENGIAAGSVGGGIIIAPVVGGSALATLTRVNANNNIAGLKTDASAGGTVIVSVMNSVFSGNAFAGVHAIFAGAQSSIMIDSSNIANTGNNGLHASGSHAIIRIARSSLIGNSGTFVAAAGAQVLSYGDNNIDGNVPNTLPSTIPHH